MKNLLTGSLTVILLALHLQAETSSPLQPSKIEPLTAQCEVGNLESCLELASLYEEGNVVPKDTAKAINIFSKVCTAKDARGCYNLANLYNHLTTLDPDKTLTNKYYTIACDSGLFESCFNYAVLSFYYSDNDKKHRERGVALFQKACYFGKIGQACDIMASLHARGDTVAKDDKKSLEYYELGCSYNFPKSCAVSSEYHKVGLGTKKDFPRSIVYMEKACSLRFMDTCSRLETMKIQAKIPVLQMQILHRNIATTSKGQIVQGASAFLLQHKGKTYALTAKHLLGDAMGIAPAVLPSEFSKGIKEWLLYNLLTRKTIEIDSILKPLDGSMPDIVLMTLKDTNISSVLKVATKDPKLHDELYIIGCPYEENFCQQNVYLLTYEGRGENEKSSQHRFTWVNKTISSKGFSGAPIVNAKGEVVAVYTGYYEKEGPSIYLGQSVKDELGRIGL